jgi:phenylalanine ammonia-lyase
MQTEKCKQNISHREIEEKTVIIRGEGLTVDDVVRVARFGTKVSLTEEEPVLEKVQASFDFIMQAVDAEKPIYGVTTGFGGMADVLISKDETTELQNNMVWFLKTGAGKRLPNEDVRAGMLLRANSLMQGISGVRLDLIRRIEVFLNAGITPHVQELGSIGASGDLVPLASITGALIGSDTSFKVDFNGEELDAISALDRLGLPQMRLAPKEGLAMTNGTSVMAGIAANCVHDARHLVGLAMGAHALFAQGLGATNQSFHPFIHRHKAHPGQVWSAAQMLALLDGSQLIRDELGSNSTQNNQGLPQDRYSLRCHPQYMGPIIDGLAQIVEQIEVEINSATDNPLIDSDNQRYFNCGNFLGQYVGVAMDHLRYYIGLIAKHLDVQIALLVSPEFSNGLPASLVGKTSRTVNMGLKGLQITGNSIMPLLTFYGNSLVDRFPTHAEQFNQNINSQGFGSANLTRQSIELFQQYMAIALMFGVQAVDLKTYAASDHYDARACLSPATSKLYEAFHNVVERLPSKDRSYIWNDNEQPLDEHIRCVANDIASDGLIPQSINDVLLSLKSFSHFKEGKSKNTEDSSQ